MIQSPILKVLFTFQKYRVKSLLIGGQACIIYGAAEFSRDTDFVILCETDNLTRLKQALKTLKARNIYVPPLSKAFLDKGHACHFRCYASAVKNLRIDIFSKMRGCSDFSTLWENRFTVKFPDRQKVEVIGLLDLVQGKKTQRDKDWVMLKRLVENDIYLTRKPSSKKIRWWLTVCRNPDTLIRLVKRYRGYAKHAITARPLLKAALKNKTALLQKLLLQEEKKEREKDKKYWAPLRRELERLRHKKTKSIE
ncbi:hypothetical protein A2Y85_07595 [candidate division WOR-3 bacterium RBG_13_43_14]|uniref:Uncharacterized protein n=1 Tax=candidate division WOR-3 bacterium RBG_13_43_14 TaxID=1802590 RepID=A0A1F4UF42_UNCW3|nr:MAG: hypothetical protein A2Y85_07595 [candidate division WOR-3 bacterium RBG_13_43_14]